MEFLLFVVFSSMEYLAIFALMFALFRFEYKFYHNSVLFICAILSFVSYSIRVGFDQAYLAPVAHLVLIFALLYYIFQVQIFYSGIMTVTGYLAYVITQTIIIITLDQVGIITISEVKENTFQGYLLQITSSLATFLIAYLIRGKNYGFAYVPHGQRAYVLYKGLNKLFLYLIILGAIVVSILIEFETDGPLLLFSTAILIVIFIVIIYLSIRKEYNND